MVSLYIIQQDNKYYDFGIVKPDMSKDAKSYNKKFLYIRRADTPTTHPQDWEYLFHVDYDGSIWYKIKMLLAEMFFYLPQVELSKVI